MTQQGEAKQARRRLGGGAIASLSGLAVLLIFVIQNREDVKFHFLFLNFIWTLWLYTIVMALFGALVWFGLGLMRRHRRRKERRENRRYGLSALLLRRSTPSPRKSPYDGGGDHVITAEAGTPGHPEWYPDEFGRLLNRVRGGHVHGSGSRQR